MNTEERLAYAIDTFPEVAPEGWVIARAVKVGQGGNASVCVVEHTDGRRGVFRCLLPNVEEADIARFYRELIILTERLSHPHIVPLLDWTKDTDKQWYISELGTPFHPYWNSRKRHTEDPDQSAHEALTIIRQVATGLAACHAEGIIHRDIKPKNIVMKLGAEKPTPMIIDFGVAFEEARERISTAEGAVGNRTYSPNIMQWRMDEVPPWLDVFELAQTLLWMLEVKSQKPYWDRPVDWRYVQFHPDLREVYAAGVRAIAASCSTQSVSPKDASEMLQLIDTLLPEEPLKLQQQMNYSALKEQILIGQSNARLEEAENHEQYEACLPAAIIFYEQLHAAVEQWHIGAQADEVPVTRNIDRTLRGVELLSTVEGVHRCRLTLYELHLGSGKSRHTFRVICQAIPPHRIPGEDGRLTSWRKMLPQKGNTITFVCEIDSRYKIDRNPWVALANDGTLIRRLISRSEPDRTSREQDVMTAEAVIHDVINRLNDPAMWQEIGR